MESYDVDERIRRLERRYQSTAVCLASYRHEFEVLSRDPGAAQARLAQVALEIDRLTRDRRLLIDKIGRLEDLPA